MLFKVMLRKQVAIGEHIAPLENHVLAEVCG